MDGSLEAERGQRRRPRRRRGGWRAAALVASTLLALLLTATPVAAHPVLLFSDPALDGALARSPDSVSLVFNEGVTVGERSITVTDAEGRAIAVAEATTQRSGTVATAALREDLEPGIYHVRWEVTGIDGHGTEGDFRFAVGVALAAGATAGTGPSPGADWPAAASTWLLLAGFVVALGGLVGEHLTARARRRHPGLPPVRSWAWAGAALGLAASAGAAALLAIEVGSTAALWGSTPGRVLLAEGAGFATALALLRSPRPGWALWPLGVVAVAEGVGSHSEVELAGAGALLTGIHLVAAGAWVGTLLHVGRAAVRWRGVPAAARRLLLDYARAAGWSLALLVVTGSAMALLLVPLPALTSSPYGRTLLVKLGLVAAVAALAITARRALRHRRPRRATRAAGAELATLALVLVATAALVSTPTPATTSTAPPPPAPRGTAVPAGGLAGQVGVNVVASDGQVVVRLATPEAGNAYEPTDEPDYALSGEVRTASGTRAPVRFRSCGTGCFVGPHPWADGDNVLSLEVRAPGWRGGGFAALVPWPVEPADDLVARTVRVMEDLDDVTVYEAGTSDTTSGLPEPDVLRVDGDTLLSGEPYNAGVAPVAALVTTDAGAERLLMGFPSAGVYAAVTLDRRGRIAEETLVGPSHVFERRFVYPTD